MQDDQSLGLPSDNAQWEEVFESSQASVGSEVAHGNMTAVFFWGMCAFGMVAMLLAPVIFSKLGLL